MIQKTKQFIFNLLREIYVAIKTRIILMSGVVLTVYNLFNFSSGSYEGHVVCGFGPSPDCPPDAYPVSTYYYYEDETLILLTVGIALIVIGLLKLRSGQN